MKKKIIAFGVCVSMLAVAIIGGTMAYFTDTDDAKNVMTLGNVKIEQIEQQRDAEGNLVDFTNDKPLMPMVDSRADQTANPVVDGWFDADMKNVVDKIVTVKNTAEPKSTASNAANSAYVRTMFAFEGRSDVQAVYIGRLFNKADWDITYMPRKGETTTEQNGLIVAREVMIKNDKGEDVVHTVIEAIYKGTDANAEKKPGVVAPGEVTSPSLKQIFMAPTANNEVADWFGEEYTIYAVTQATQVEGFTDAESALDAAFGDPATVDDQTMYDWFNKTNP